MKMKRGRYVVFPTPPPASRVFSFRSRNIRLNLTQMVGHPSQVLRIHSGLLPNQLEPPRNRPHRAPAPPRNLGNRWFLDVEKRYNCRASGVFSLNQNQIRNTIFANGFQLG